MIFIKVRIEKCLLGTSASREDIVSWVRQMLPLFFKKRKNWKNFKNSIFKSIRNHRSNLRHGVINLIYLCISHSFWFPAFHMGSQLILNEWKQSEREKAHIWNGRWRKMFAASHSQSLRRKDYIIWAPKGERLVTLDPAWDPKILCYKNLIVLF